MSGTLEATDARRGDPQAPAEDEFIRSASGSLFAPLAKESGDFIEAHFGARDDWNRRPVESTRLKL
jgi:hypothetical protein